MVTKHVQRLSTQTHRHILKKVEFILWDSNSTCLSEILKVPRCGLIVKLPTLSAYLHKEIEGSTPLSAHIVLRWLLRNHSCVLKTGHATSLHDPVTIAKESRREECAYRNEVTPLHQFTQIPAL